jgi:hypothetical protein
MTGFNPNDTRRHIELLTGKRNAVMNFRTIPESEVTVRRVYSTLKETRAKMRLKFRGSFAELRDTLERRNRDGFAIYYTLNETDGKGTKAANMVAARALILDLDGAPLPDAWEIAPHLIIETSRGKHQCLWIIERTTDLAAVEAINRRLALHYDGDPSVSDSARVLRLAGFVHQKPGRKPFTSRIVKANEFDRPATLEEFAAFLPRLPKRRASSGANGVGLIDAAAARLIFEHFPVEALASNEAWLAFAMALHSASDGDGDVAELFFEFCLTDPAYASDIEDAMNRQRYESFTADREDGVTIGTLKKICRDKGVPGPIMFAAFNDAARDFENV